MTCAAAPPKPAPCLQAMHDMEKYWQKQFDQNYSRSLDHRSFYFKSIDKKVLGNRHILSELKDAAEAHAARPEAALVVHAGVPEAIKLHPHLILDMPSKCVPRASFVSASQSHMWHKCLPTYTMFAESEPQIIDVNDANNETV
jgi:histone deacetylase complex regulatory component SIN3